LLFWIGGCCARTKRFRFLAGTAWSVASPPLIQRVKSNDGSLEKLVQRELRAKGLRFRCHVRTPPGRPDIVFPSERVAVFVDGDFWHGWRLPRGKRSSLNSGGTSSTPIAPATNATFAASAPSAGGLSGSGSIMFCRIWRDV
jgi:hypothetical protein